MHVAVFGKTGCGCHSLRFEARKVSFLNIGMIRTIVINLSSPFLISILLRDQGSDRIKVIDFGSSCFQTERVKIAAID